MFASCRLCKSALRTWPGAPQALVGLLDELNLSRPHLAGWSFGACASLKLAVEQPHRISKASRLGARPVGGVS